MGSSKLKACQAAAIAGGRAALAELDRKAHVKPSVLGHHAIVSPADYAAQQAISSALGRRARGVFHITEEMPLPVDDAFDLEQNRFFLVDELDGSSTFSAGHFEWSASVAYIDRLVHTAAAVYAPLVEGGTLFWASAGGGSFVRRQARCISISRARQMRVETTELPESYVLLGPDMLLPRYPQQNRIALTIADRCRTINICGSCALGLGLVAAGHATALIQPPQMPWDWAAGRLLVEEAGGIVLFYEMNGGDVVELERPAVRHYGTDGPTLGLIAGSDPVARAIMDVFRSTHSS